MPRLPLQFIALLFFATSLSAQNAVSLDKDTDLSLGQYIEYFQEPGEPLTLEQALKQFQSAENIHENHGNSLSLGIGVKPVWIKVILQNPNLPADYRVSIETPWLDYIDSWLIEPQQTVGPIHGGDGVPFAERPLAYRYYGFYHPIATGETQMVMRVQSLGPMAIPLRISSAEQAVKRDISTGYRYGMLMGVLFALAMFNLILFLQMGYREIGLYCLYLLGFITNSLSYTGHLHTIITPDFGPYFQDWLDNFLMITYSVAGLHFARVLLATKDYAPKLDRFVVVITLIFPAAIALCALFNQLVWSLSLAFILNSGFVMLFIVMAILALKAQVKFAKVFLIASVQAATCIAISTLAVAGVVPYNDITFNLIELGMAIEAFLFALILAQRFRLVQNEKELAEKYAKMDTLTQLYNRRGFSELVEKLWETIKRNQGRFSLILFDIDHFKEINDRYGHAAGDKVLSHLAQTIAATVRKGDVVARWGGEEFIVFLPETSQSDALHQANRLREQINKLSINCQEPSGLNQSGLEQLVRPTCSFGVVGFDFSSPQIQSHSHIDSLISKADRAMYLAKNQGRNCVCYFPQSDEKTAQIYHV